MRQSKKCIDVTEDDMEQCNTARQFLQHPKLQQYARILNRKIRLLSPELNLPSNIDIHAMVANPQEHYSAITALASYAVRHDDGVRVPLNKSGALTSRIRQVESRLIKIAWQEEDDASLDAPFIR